MTYIFQVNFVEGCSEHAFAGKRTADEEFAGELEALLPVEPLEPIGPVGSQTHHCK